MIKSMTKKTNNKKGFTLIELIVVIAILGILAAIAIPRFSGVQENANVKAVKATLKNIDSGIAIVAAEKNKAISTVTAAEVATALNWTAPTAAAAGNFVGTSPADVTYSIASGAASAEVGTDVAWPTGLAKTAVTSSLLQSK